MIVSTLKNVWSPSSLQGFINHQFNTGPWKEKGPNEKQEQDSADLERGPACPTQNMMEQIEMRFLLQSYCSQGCRDCPTSTREECSFNQQHDLLPGRSGKSRSKWS